MRRGKLIGLKLDGINRDNRLVTLHQAKGRKDRVVPIGQRALDWIDKYEQVARPKLLDEPTDVLFLTTRGNSLHPNTLTAVVRSYLTAAGIKKRGSCHMLRHKTATLMLEGGADLRVTRSREPQHDADLHARDYQAASRGPRPHASRFKRP